MRALFLALSLLAFGCDSAAVHEHIIDNFVCVYAPYWMFSDGDCQNSETAAKVESVLDHGLTSAHVECSVSDFSAPPAFSYEYFSYEASLLQDGSCFASLTGSVASPFPLGRQALSGFTPRGSSLPCKVDSIVSPNQTLYISAGELASDASVTTYALDTYCTGFNIEAFEELP